MDELRKTPSMMVASQANTSREAARAAIDANSGDLDIATQHLLDSDISIIHNDVQNTSSRVAWANSTVQPVNDEDRADSDSDGEGALNNTSVPAPAKPTGEAVRVVIRVRPPNQNEATSGSRACLQVNAHGITLDCRGDEGKGKIQRSFSFSRILPSHSSQSDVYAEVVAYPASNLNCNPNPDPNPNPNLNTTTKSF